MQDVRVLSTPSGDRIDSAAPVSTPNHWLTRLFGCRHMKMNSPFTLNDDTYCTCMNCGARRHFNVKRSKMTGAYYFASASVLYDAPSPKQVVSVTQGEQTGALPQNQLTIPSPAKA